MSDRFDWNAKTIAEFRANEGRVGGVFESAPLVLVHHRGRKSGREHVNPAMYLPDDTERDIIYVFATKGGAPSNPDWRYNLTAAGEGSVERGTETYKVTVRDLTGAERNRIYAEQARRYPGFTEYARQTAGIRTIPVLELTRAEPTSLRPPVVIDYQPTHTGERRSGGASEGERIAGQVTAAAAGDHRQGGGHAGEVVEDVDKVGGQKSNRSEQLGELVHSVAKQFPDVQWELYRVTVLGDTVAVEASIQGTFLGALETSAGIYPANGSEDRRPDRRLLPPTRVRSLARGRALSGKRS